VITAVGIALLPKCPACWSVYAGLSSMLGVSFVVDPTLLSVLTIASLGLAVAALASMALRTRSYLPLTLGAASALGVWAGKFELNSDVLTWLGLLGLMLAAFSARRRGGRVHARAAAAPSELADHAQAG
jgi:hypothetical protein